MKQSNSKLYNSLAHFHLGRTSRGEARLNHLNEAKKLFEQSRMLASLRQTNEELEKPEDVVEEQLRRFRTKKFRWPRYVLVGATLSIFVAIHQYWRRYY